MYRDWVKILGVLLIKPTYVFVQSSAKLHVQKSVVGAGIHYNQSQQMEGSVFLINVYHDQCMYQWQLLCDNIINANFMYQLYTIIWYFFSSHLEIKIRQTFCIRCYAAAKILLLHKWCHNLKVSNYCKLTISGMHFLSV